MSKWLRRIGIATFGVAGFTSLIGCAYLQQPQFGALPGGTRLQAVERSPHYVDGEFRSVIATPMRTQDSSFASNLMLMLFDRNPNLRPAAALPFTQIDFKVLSPNEDVVVWLGHSSYYVQLNGKRILIDPVFSTNASPLPLTNLAFPGTSPYTADDMPPIDLLLVTHDHWDHLDYDSVKSLLPKVSHVVVGLGVGEFFDQWGYPVDRIHEADWNEVLEPVAGLRIHVLPARHYSGRLFTRNKTLWVAFALESPQRRLFFSGDSGYGPHFREIGERFGGFDLVALDMGQYDQRWANIHMTPEEAARAAEALRARTLLPAHVGRFSIARHAWDEPFERITTASEDKSYRLSTPKIGEPLDLRNEGQRLSRWWVGANPIASSANPGRTP